jgi:hypothetical protein
MEAVDPMYQAMRGYAVDRAPGVLSAALKESPAFIADLARESKIVDQRILDLLNGKYARFFGAFMIFARVAATLGLVAYDIWFTRRLRRISMEEKFESEEQRQTEIARTVAGVSVWVGTGRGILPLLFEIWVSFVITMATTHVVKFVLEENILGQMLRTAAEAAKGA